MGIKPIKQKSVSNEVLEQIKANIISGEWPPGTKIPGEIELTQLFGVSRISVREAIHRLAGMGILSIRRGQGTFVSEVLPQDYFSSLLPILMIDRVGLGEMVEFRAMIEVESARLAAMRANEEDIARMEKIIGRMEEKAGNLREFAQEDLNFHMAIAMATHNNVVIKVNAILHDMLETAMEEIINIMGVQGGLYYHRKILEAVKKRDCSKAVKVMKEHIDRTIEKVNEFGIGV